MVQKPILVEFPQCKSKEQQVLQDFWIPIWENQTIQALQGRDLRWKYKHITMFLGMYGQKRGCCIDGT